MSSMVSSATYDASEFVVRATSCRPCPKKGVQQIPLLETKKCHVTDCKPYYCDVEERVVAERKPGQRESLGSALSH